MDLKYFVSIVFFKVYNVLTVFKFLQLGISNIQYLSVLLKNQNRISIYCCMCNNHKIVSHTISKLFHFLSDCNQNVIHTCMTPAQEKMIVMGKSIESFINVYDILSFWK